LLQRRRRTAGWDRACRVRVFPANGETIKQAVMADMGISFLSAHTVTLGLAAGKLAILDV